MTVTCLRFPVPCGDGGVLGSRRLRASGREPEGSLVVGSFRAEPATVHFEQSTAAPGTLTVGPASSLRRRRSSCLRSTSSLLGLHLQARFRSGRRPAIGASRRHRRRVVLGRGAAPVGPGRRGRHRHRRTGNRQLRAEPPLVDAAPGPRPLRRCRRSARHRRDRPSMRATRLSPTEALRTV